MRIRQSALVLVLSIAVSRAGAQQPVAYSIDVAAGAGRHTAHTANTWYLFRVAGYSRAAMSIIFPQNRRVQATVTVERASTFFTGGNDLCRIEPNGTCGASFPELAGYGASAGVRVHADSGIDLDIGAGGASLNGPSEFITGDVAFALGTHVSAVLGIQPMLLQQRSGEHLWWVPVTLGIRFD